MEFQFTDIGDVRMVKLVGRLDSAGVDMIETRFGATIVAAGKPTVVNLAEVAFLASLGVRMLLTTTRSLSQKGSKLALYGAQPHVLEVIETMGFQDIVPFANSEAEAIALVAG